MNYEVIIPATLRNKSILELSLPYIEEFLNPGRIVILCKASLKIESDIQFEYIDEDTLYEGLCYEHIRTIIENRDKYAIKRTGWYLQQFLKLAYAYRCNDEYYISWDADTIPLRNISMEENGKPVFDIKEEYHRPYFTTINRLFQNKVCRKNNFSYISEHMIFNKKYVMEMLAEIDANCLLSGMSVFDKIMDAVRDIDLLWSGFSEFETYGNFVQNRFPDAYCNRHLKSLRDGDVVYGNNPTKEDLKNASIEYDLITFENRRIR